VSQNIDLVLKTYAIVFIQLTPLQNQTKDTPYLDIILMATFSPDFLLIARLTVAKLPLLKNERFEVFLHSEISINLEKFKDVFAELNHISFQ